MAVFIRNRSNVLTNSAVASLERGVWSGSFLSDVSRENELSDCLQEYLEHELDFNHPVHGGDLESEQKVWTDFFRFMPNDGGGIMSHINTLMAQEHGHLVHDWKHVVGHAHQMEHLIRNVKRFRILCKDFQIQDREYDCLTSNFLVEKPRGLRMDEQPFFITTRMMRKLRISRGNYSVIELRDKYELLENFLLHDGGHFDDTFKLGSTVVQVESIKDGSTLKTVTIKVNSEISGGFTNFGGKVLVSFASMPDSGPHIANIAEIKLVGRVLSCLKHMSNYNSDEAQFGVIDNLYKVGCDNFIVAKSPTIDEIIHMWPPNDLVLVDLSQVSDLPLIFGTGISTIDQIH
jgi:hypothetical protein